MFFFWYLYVHSVSIGSPVTKLWLAVQNAENGVVRGHSTSWALPPFDRAHTTSYSTLIETMWLSFTVSEIQPVTCPKSLILPHPTCIWRLRRVTPVDFRGDLRHQKTRVPGLSCDVVCVIPCLAVLVELRLVSDRQTQAYGYWLPRIHSIAR